MEIHKDKITTDFQTNKHLIEIYTDVTNKKLRNQLAGYLVREKKKSGRVISHPKLIKGIKKDTRRVKTSIDEFIQ